MAAESDACIAVPLSAENVLSSRIGAGAFSNSTSPLSRSVETPVVRSVASMVENTDICMSSGERSGSFTICTL